MPLIGFVTCIPQEFKFCYLIIFKDAFIKQSRRRVCLVCRRGILRMIFRRIIPMVEAESPLGNLSISLSTSLSIFFDEGTLHKFVSWPRLSFSPYLLSFFSALFQDLSQHLSWIFDRRRNQFGHGIFLHSSIIFAKLWTRSLSKLWSPSFNRFALAWLIMWCTSVFPLYPQIWHSSLTSNPPYRILEAIDDDGVSDGKWT